MSYMDDLFAGAQPQQSLPNQSAGDPTVQQEGMHWSDQISAALGREMAPGGGVWDEGISQPRVDMRAGGYNSAPDHNELRGQLEDQQLQKDYDNHYNPEVMMTNGEWREKVKENTAKQNKVHKQAMIEAGLTKTFNALGEMFQGPQDIQSFGAPYRGEHIGPVTDTAANLRELMAQIITKRGI